MADPESTAAEPNSPTTPTTPSSPTRSQNGSIVKRLRNASLSLMEAPVPSGFFQATGEQVGTARSVNEIKRDSVIDSRAQELVRQQTITEEGSDAKRPERERLVGKNHDGIAVAHPSSANTTLSSEQAYEGEKQNLAAQELATIAYDDEDEVKLTKGQAIKKALSAFWKWFLTPLGFGITIYFLLVVAWGGMIFLLLCNAAPAMRGPYAASDKRSKRSIWIEIDSQVLNALFCVTGFGLIPWRFRDFYFLMRYRIKGDLAALNHLANIHRSWFRIDDQGPRTYALRFHRSDEELHVMKPHEHRTLARTRTGQYASATKIWKMDAVVWFYVLNTIFQIILAAGMWSMNRYNRPSWYTAIFIVLGFGVAIAAGVVVFMEGRRIKKIEGAPLKPLPLEKISESDKADILEKKMDRKWWKIIDRDAL